MFDLEIVILGNFNVLLLRRRSMSSDNAAGSRLSLLLVSIMILPSLLAIVSTNEVSEEMEIERSSKGSMEIPSYIPNANDYDSDSDVYGWISDKGNIGAAHLFHRTATYVPIQDWEQRTGEGVISGWHVLGRTYPIPSDWKAELEDIGLECRTFFSPQGLHCNVPKLCGCVQCGPQRFFSQPIPSIFW